MISYIYIFNRSWVDTVYLQFIELSRLYMFRVYQQPVINRYNEANGTCYTTELTVSGPGQAICSPYYIPVLMSSFSLTFR
jgi:hypothetical protein